jgi:hypothetical protein
MPAATLTRTSILDQEQHEYYFTTSDNKTYKQWCTSDLQAAAWADEYKTAADSLGITLRNWGRTDDAVIRRTNLI